MEILTRLFLGLFLIPFGFMIIAFFAVMFPFIIIFGKITIDDVPLKQWLKDRQ